MAELNNSSLAIEGLGRAIQIDRSSEESGSPVSERRVLNQMAQEGMQAPTGDAKAALTTFSEALRKSVDQVNTQQVEADNAIKDLVSGRSKNIHETLLTVEKADASLKLMMQVRNKILDAYREIMRMQV